MVEFLPFESFIDPNKRVFWLYILSSSFIAGVYLFFNRSQMRSNLSFKLWFHPSAKLDYLYFFVSYFLKVALILPIIFGGKEVAIFTNRTLYDLFDYNPITGVSQEVIFPLFTLSLFIVSDFTRYWLHRLLHTVPFLWEFHKVHHSAKVLNPFTFYRVHPVENLLFGLRYALSIGFVTGVFIYFFGGKIGVVDILGANILVFVFSLLGSNLRHSHIKLSYPKVLEKIFISPYQHQIHHSTKHYNKNFGGYLALWDLLFNSIAFSKDVGVIKFGIKKEQMKDFTSIKGLLFSPFLKLKKEKS